MDADQFRQAAHAVVEQKSLQTELPNSAPTHSEPWDAIQADYQNLVLPRMTDWSSPGFAAFFPSGTSYPSMLGEFLASSFAGSMFSWICSPAATELEEVVMDWVAEALDLPTSFYHNKPSSKGGGLIMSSASESVITAMAAARDRALEAIRLKDPTVATCSNWRQKEASNFVVFGSETTHSSVMKAAKVLNLQYVTVPAPYSNDFRMVREQLCQELESSISNGFIPVFVAVTLGTTSTCAFDDLEGIGKLLDDHPLIWGHVDAAYGGNALLLPEFKYLSPLLRPYASFTVNLNKGMSVTVDGSCLFIRDKFDLASSFTCYGSYLNPDKTIGGPQSLKIWFVLRSFGLEKLRETMRRGFQLGEEFANLLKDQQDLFEIISGPRLGVVAFRIKAPSSNGSSETLHERSNRLTLQVCQDVNASGQAFLTGCTIGDFYVIRMVTTHVSNSPASIRSILGLIIQAASRGENATCCKPSSV
ncbi:hypothetical protein N7456_009933 [Penicillium angulare]|uniref:Aromatic-L-amino-acid decarboxylase n=1 Tax=Penicillium angulare TaxID=116970 RepID=A0A9W9F5V1_9EURO|nr:hypothetical protein N7456_009933 [Penicillium angulare]